eukprot:scpid105468/ scgid16715/ 
MELRRRRCFVAAVICVFLICTGLASWWKYIYNGERLLWNRYGYNAAGDPARILTKVEKELPVIESFRIRKGTFAYLVMGKGKPPDIWKRYSLNPDVFVFYLSWKEQPLTMVRSSKYKMSHLSGSSTWASGRNKLLSLAIETEREQGWEFEYFVFWDSDVRLLYRRNQTGF